MNETHTPDTYSELSKLRWQCRRGMKELDVILSHYLEQHYVQADQDEKQQFKTLLLLEDPMLIMLLQGNVKEDGYISDALRQKLLYLNK